MRHDFQTAVVNQRQVLRADWCGTCANSLANNDLREAEWSCVILPLKSPRTVQPVQIWSRGPEVIANAPLGASPVVAKNVLDFSCVHYAVQRQGTNVATRSSHPGEESMTRHSAASTSRSINFSPKC
jgi:hypothetical protein